MNRFFLVLNNRLRVRTNGECCRTDDRTAKVIVCVVPALTTTFVLQSTSRTPGGTSTGTSTGIGTGTGTGSTSGSAAAGTSTGTGTGTSGGSSTSGCCSWTTTVRTVPTWRLGTDRGSCQSC